MNDINAKDLKEEVRQEIQEDVLDIFCTIVFTPYINENNNLEESLFDINSYSTTEAISSNLNFLKYIGDIHCQRVIYQNITSKKGEQIESPAPIIVNCSDIVFSYQLDTEKVKEKINLAKQQIQSIIFKYYSFDINLHISVYCFTLTEDIALCFSNLINKDINIQPEDLPLYIEITNNKELTLFTKNNDVLNIDFIIIYDTFPIIASNMNLDISQKDSSSNVDNISPKYVNQEKNNENINTVENYYQDSLDYSENDRIEVVKNEDNTGIVLKGQITKYDVSDEFIEDTFLNSLLFINPSLFITISSSQQFVNYIRTENGKLWWSKISENLHFLAEETDKNASNTADILFKTSMVGYTIAGGTLLTPAAPAAPEIAAGATLVLFGSGVASTISTISKTGNMFLYLLDYVSDPINNSNSIDKASETGKNIIKDYIIQKSVGKAGEKVLKNSRPQKHLNLDEQTNVLKKNQAKIEKQGKHLDEQKKASEKNQNELEDLDKSNRKKSYKKKRRKELLKTKKNIDKNIEKSEIKLRNLEQQQRIYTMKTNMYSTQIIETTTEGLNNNHTKEKNK